MDNQRLILFLVFGFSLFMLWQEWQKQHQPPVPTVQTATPAPATSDPVPAPSTLPAGGAVPAVASGTAGSTARIQVRTDLFAVDISAQGGDITHLELLRHKATEDKSRNFVLFDEKHAYAAQSGLIGPGLPNHKSLWQLPAGGLELKDGENELRVRLEASAENGVRVAKTYIFKRDDYRIDVEYEIANDSPAPLAAQAYFHLIRDGKAIGRWPVVIGAPETPTPVGHFQVKSKVVNPVYQSTSSGKVKGGRPNLQSTSNNRQQKGSALHSQGGDTIDQKLLIVGNEGENTGFLKDGKEFLRLLEGEAKVLELGEDAEFRRFFKEA